MTKHTIALFIGLALLIGGVIWWFTTKKPITAKITKTIQPTLNSLAQNSVSKAEVIDLIAHQSLGIAPIPISTPPPTDTGGSLVIDDYLQAYLDKRGSL